MVNIVKKKSGFETPKSGVDVFKKQDGLAVKKSGLDVFKLRKKAGLSSLALQNVEKEAPGAKSLQLLVMFDITGSMFENFEIVREKINEIANLLKEGIENFEMTIFAFRDHGDEERYGNIYYASEFTGSIEKIREKMQDIKKGGGGPNGLTCMEECLREASKLDWKNGYSKAIVVIGDMPPHGVLDAVSVCPNEINYQFEIEELAEKKISIYSVFCGRIKKVEMFYQEIAEDTGGRFLALSEINLLADILVGVGMKKTGQLKDYILKLKSVNRLSPQKEKALLLLE